MKRRDFLLGSALAGVALPQLARSQTKPCPPPTITVAGGTSATTGCGAATAQADWVARSNGPGVVWAHRFTDAASVNKFIVAGDLARAQQDVFYAPNDGIMGDGCLCINTPAGQTQSGSWGRPMQPIPGDINRANLPVAPDFAQVTPSFNNWFGGFFGHRDYNARWPGQYIGTDYYLQFRAKFHPNRWNSNEPSGKMLMLVTSYTTPAQEIVVQALTPWGGGYYNMYTSVGTNFNSFLTDPQGSPQGASIQPGGLYKSTCVIGQSKLGAGSNNCWVWPTNEWVTVLIHVIPGHQNVSGNLSDPANPKDTGIEVWAARAGQTSYTKIWQKLDYVWHFDNNYINGDVMPFGWNWLNFTSFTGGAVAVPSVNGYYHRHDQVIFSTQFIPCPQV
jgi:hypothetical protein